MKFFSPVKVSLASVALLCGLVSATAFADNTDEFARKAVRWDLDKRCDVTISHTDNVLTIQDLHLGYKAPSQYADCDQRNSKQLKTIFCVTAVATVLPGENRKNCEVSSASLAFDYADGRPASLYSVSTVKTMKLKESCDSKKAEKILEHAKDADKRAWSCDQNRSRD